MAVEKYGRKRNFQRTPEHQEAEKHVRADARALHALLQKYPGVQLATLVDQPPDGNNWFHEIKFDGYRLLGFQAGRAVSLRTRNGLDWTSEFPSVVRAMEKLEAKDAVLDMEAVVLDQGGRSSFQALQAALGEGGNRDRILAYAFDLLHLNGESLTHLGLAERKRKLEALLESSKTGADIQFSAHVAGDGREMLARSCELGLEGIVSKQSDAPYIVRRDKTWLKSKCIKRQEFIIVGYSNPRKGDRSLGALYLSYYKNGELKYGGKVGTGFTMKNARELTDRLALLTATEPVLGRRAMAGISRAEWEYIHWTKPELLCEVAFTEWTADGYVRHPSFQGLREDKEPSGVQMEKAVAVEKPTALPGKMRQHDNRLPKGQRIPNR